MQLGLRVLPFAEVTYEANRPEDSVWRCLIFLGGVFVFVFCLLFFV